MKFFWFNKEKKTEDGTQLDIEEFRRFRKIGETFYYLGRTCIVTAHSTYLPHMGVIPLLEFDYADDHGVLHSGACRLSELPALRAQNGEST